jgi:hypothetical protein
MCVPGWFSPVDFSQWPSSKTLAPTKTTPVPFSSPYPFLLRPLFFYSAVIEDTRAILESADVSEDEIQQVVNDLKSIAAELKNREE